MNEAMPASRSFYAAAGCKKLREIAEMKQIKDYELTDRTKLITNQLVLRRLSRRGKNEN